MHYFMHVLVIVLWVVAAFLIAYVAIPLFIWCCRYQWLEAEVDLRRKEEARAAREIEKRSKELSDIIDKYRKFMNPPGVEWHVGDKSAPGKSIAKAVIGLDGNQAYALIGEDIQSGEVEFESVTPFVQPYHAAKRALTRLCQRLYPEGGLVDYKIDKSLFDATGTTGPEGGRHRASKQQDDTPKKEDWISIRVDGKPLSAPKRCKGEDIVALVYGPERVGKYRLHAHGMDGGYDNLISDHEELVNEDGSNYSLSPIHEEGSVVR